jgi:glycogen debranching enzyme
VDEEGGVSDDALPSAEESGVTENVRRPTPADPWPEPIEDEDLPSPTGRSLPPDLGPGAVAVLEGVSFMYSDATGDVPPGSIGGLVHADTRLLSTWLLTLNGARLLPLRSGSVEHFSAAFFLTNPELPGMTANEFGVRRLRAVGSRLRERIELWCFAREPRQVQLRLHTGTDFADLFEIKDTVRDRSAQIIRSHAADGSTLEYAYRNGDFAVRTRVEVSPPPDTMDGDDLIWELNLAADATWTLEITVPFDIGPNEVVPVHTGFGEVEGGVADDATARWFAEVPALQSDSDLLVHIGEQTARDLLALRVEMRLEGLGVILPAAGLPWFLTVFGRDTLITAYQSVSFGPQLARGALLQLAALQGTAYDDFKDEEPGKILHEVRQGELTRLGLKPHSPYYGTADATMLWLILLSEYWRWTGDAAMVKRLIPNIRAALNWIDKFGDFDGDGYVEYQTRSPQGLGNHCWRDSWDGVQFADGRLPYLPIATCELQGYVYDAKRRVAELADGPIGDPALATRLRTEAAALRERFNADFWIDERGGYYALGLDGDKNQIDSLSSNIGHLLWSGIVPDDRARLIARQLMSESMFSGWGVRTTSTKDKGFNPIGYHLGTVWPHDNSLIALGLARYGYREEANQIATAQIEAAGHFNYRLPEAFAGYPRSVARFPVPYPTACSPHAWATAAPLALLRSMLGLDARNGELILDPVVPHGFGRIAVRGIAAFGSFWDVEAMATTGSVTPSATRRRS